MWRDDRGAEASEVVIVGSIIAATVLGVLVLIYTTLGDKLEALLEEL